MNDGMDDGVEKGMFEVPNTKLITEIIIKE